MSERKVWLILIEMPKELMDDIREGSIELAGQTVDLGELDTAYDEDLDQEANDGETEDQDENQPQLGGVGMPTPGGM